jgi:predicted aminopeptidase
MQAFLRICLCAAVLLASAGCAQLGYYVQAMQGQMSLMSEARPIDQWLADPQVKDELKGRLKRVREIRAYAAHELGLPDNGSYKNYADLKRKFVMWNVVATPELSIEPNQWCFPVAGCVDYRGYYSKEAAQAFAADLQRQGFDVRVAGVPAYSTLGWFNDPVLSTFIDYSDAELARLVFHELAHQVAYASNDSQFNESFATTVEEVGVARWLDSQGDDGMRASYQAYQQRREDFLQLMARHRQQLQENFKRPVSDADKRKRKAAIFESLHQDYAQIKQLRWDGYAGYDHWFAGAMSNADFALMATYHDLVPALRNLLLAKKTLQAFYQSVRELARLDKATRRKRLAVFANIGSEADNASPPRVAPQYERPALFPSYTPH